MLRSELVYQLKKALEQNPDFVLEGPLTHLLVDEYQDLNKCDLAVIDAIKAKGVQLYVAGDDDQSIYGFRKAHPDGIRNFVDMNAGAGDLKLKTCMLCAPAILSVAQFVANGDTRRLEKDLIAQPGRTGGEVAILQFREQEAEAKGISKIVAHLIHEKAIAPEEILVLLRSDRKRAFSSVIRTELKSLDIPVASPIEDPDEMNFNDNRKIRCYLNLIANSEDSLAWRTILQWDNNGIGEKKIGAVCEYARAHGLTFARAVRAIQANADCIDFAAGRKIEEVADQVNATIKTLAMVPQPDASDEEESGSCRNTLSRG